MPLRWQKIHLWLADLKVSLSNSSQKLIYLVGRGLMICSHYWSLSIILQKLNIQILENWELLSEYMYYWYYWLNKPCILLFWFDCVMCALHISLCRYFPFAFLFLAKIPQVGDVGGCQELIHYLHHWRSVWIGTTKSKHKTRFLNNILTYLGS